MSLSAMALSLDGLSVGDAFGERFFGPPGLMSARIAARELPQAPWGWTDDTEMASAICEVLAAKGTIDQDLLAKVFARRYRADRHRGYGAAAHGILEELGDGSPWEVVAQRPFGGTGSKGNGGAMRAAPIGAFFAGDPQRVVDEARKSAQVTHAHPEGQAGAIAVALAASWASKPTSEPLLQFVLRWLPESQTRTQVQVVSALPEDHEPWRVATRVGAGERVLAEDTVPFSLWCAASRLDSYEEALWATVSGLGDRDTTCAIVGGIVALRSPIPPGWLSAREPLR
jgi:ADP-ribosylglycohydrolase